MKFGVREICNVVFRATGDTKIGNFSFKKGQPVLYIDSAKASTLEGSATSVYATGGRGNTRLLTWEGEKTLSFSVEDALISELGMAVLSGAGLIKSNEGEKVHVHTTVKVIVDGSTITVPETICATAPVFVIPVEEDGSLTSEVLELAEETPISGKTITLKTAADGKQVFVDYYITKDSDKVGEIIIDAAHFAGYYYVEAETLFRKQKDGIDAPVAITLPKVKIQSNFSFNMSSSGDPSTFNFQMDASPGYTWFNPTKEVLCVMQIIKDAEGVADSWESVMLHNASENPLG